VRNSAAAPWQPPHATRRPRLRGTVRSYCDGRGVIASRPDWPLIQFSSANIVRGQRIDRRDDVSFDLVIDDVGWRADRVRRTGAGDRPVHSLGRSDA
jgi:hypothetical protein